MIRDQFIEALNIYEHDRLKFLTRGESKIGLSSLRLSELLEKQLPRDLANEAHIPSLYIIKGSIGKGNIAAIPHVCIMDKDITTSPRHGYYIVYLVHPKKQKIFLSFNQGFTEYTTKYGEKKGSLLILENARKAQKYLRSTQGFIKAELPWGKASGLAKGYMNGNICYKEYSISTFPEDLDLIRDLNNMIGLYRELKGMIGNSMINIEDVRSEDEYQDEVQRKGEEQTEEEEKPYLRKSTVPAGLSKDSYPRDPKVASRAIEKANYQCENDPSHHTFPSKFGHKFAEAHHLIPLEYYEKFEYDIDIVQNIISLCPTCHRAFHHSESDYQNELISRFFMLRKEELSKMGILITLSDLKNLYRGQSS